MHDALCTEYFMFITSVAPALNLLRTAVRKTHVGWSVAGSGDSAKILSTDPRN